MTITGYIETLDEIIEDLKSDSFSNAQERKIEKLIDLKNDLIKLESLMEREEAHLKISTHFKNEGGLSYKNLLTISGEYLIRNNLTEAWAELRNIDVQVITPEWTDSITLFQAKHLGILDFIYD